MMHAPITAERLDYLARAGRDIHLRPVYAAMRTAGVSLFLVRQGHFRFVAPRVRGFVALIGDDLDRSLGPAGFHRKSVRRLLAAAHGVALISCEIQPDVYATAAQVAALGRSTVIVETQPEHEGEWLALIQHSAPRASLLICTVAAGTA